MTIARWFPELLSLAMDLGGQLGLRQAYPISLNRREREEQQPCETGKRVGQSEQLIHGDRAIGGAWPQRLVGQIHADVQGKAQTDAGIESAQASEDQKSYSNQPLR